MLYQEMVKTSVSYRVLARLCTLCVKCYTTSSTRNFVRLEEKRILDMYAQSESALLFISICNVLKKHLAFMYIMWVTSVFFLTLPVIMLQMKTINYGGLFLTLLLAAALIYLARHNVKRISAIFSDSIFFKILNMKV